MIHSSELSNRGYGWTWDALHGTLQAFGLSGTRVSGLGSPLHLAPEVGAVLRWNPQPPESDTKPIVSAELN